MAGLTRGLRTRRCLVPALLLAVYVRADAAHAQLAVIPTQAEPRTEAWILFDEVNIKLNRLLRF